jgi:hypothetical protein
MGTWVAEVMEASAASPRRKVEFLDFTLALEAVCEVEDANHGHIRFWPPDDATPEQLRSLMRAGAFIITRTWC